MVSCLTSHSSRRALKRAPRPRRNALRSPAGRRTGLLSRRRSLLVRRSGSGLRALKPHGVTRRRQSLLGRSQAVRQRILIPPFPGSIPGAPANLFKDLALLLLFSFPLLGRLIPTIVRLTFGF